MGIPVAVDGDIEAEAGTIIPPLPYCPGGSWSAGVVNEVLGAKVSQAGKKVVLSATCTFTYTGSPPPIGCTTTLISVVTLTPGVTKLKDNGFSVLRLNDTTSDSYGNKLTANPTQTKLKSA